MDNIHYSQNPNDFIDAHIPVCDSSNEKRKQLINIINKNERVALKHDPKNFLINATLAYILWYSLYNRNKNTLIIAPNVRSCGFNEKFFREMYLNINDDFKFVKLEQVEALLKYTKMIFDNGSSIIFTSSDIQQPIRYDVQPDSYDFIYVTECSKLINENVDTIESLLLMTNARIVLLNTEESKMFDRFFNGAMRYQNEFLSVDFTLK